MAVDDFIFVPVWKRYTRKMEGKILRPTNSGFFIKEEAEERQMRFVAAENRDDETGSRMALYWLVDETDGMIVDAKFQVFGPSSLIAALDATCDLLVGKNLAQAKRLSAELIDKQLRDKPDIPAFPVDLLPYLNWIVETIEKAIETCSDIPFSQNYISPLPKDELAKEGGGYPGWIELEKEKKLAVIEKVFDEEIRPYIELDSGGIQILGLIGDRELIVSYQGACTSCYSSIGATLSTIQQIVQDKIHPELIVVPNLDDLKL